MNVLHNPLLGPDWEPVAQVLTRLVEDVRRGRMFSVQTYMLRFGLTPYDSPYLQAILDDDDRIQMEISGNLQVTPQLSEEEYQQLEFYGWTRPEVTPEEYSAGGSGGNPNFVRYFEKNADVVDIVEFILTTLVGVYGMIVDDFWGFDSAGQAARIAAMNKLARLKASSGNPDAVIFALPGRHDELCDEMPDAALDSRFREVE